MYTKEEIIKIINDYADLRKYTEGMIKVDIEDIPINFDIDGDVVIDTHYYDLYEEDEFDKVTIPIEYYSMTDEEIEEDKQKKKEEARIKAEEEKRKYDEELAKRIEEDERKLLAELKSKYEHLED